MDDQRSGSQGVGPARRSTIPAIIMVAGIICLGISTYYGFNSPSQNVTLVESQGMTVELAPGNITVPGFLQKYVSLEVTAQGNQNFSSIAIEVLSSGTGHEIFNSSFTPRSYAVAVFQLPAKYIGPEVHLIVKFSGNVTVQITARFAPSNLGLYAEILLSGSVVLIIAGVLKINISFRRYWLLFPFFFIISVIYGQRYDDYFMVSLGMRILGGVDPYTHSTLIAQGLIWEYPPGYAPWSILVTFIYHTVLGYSIPSQQQLNFVGTIYGDRYSAWRALAATNLFFLYGLAKIPFIIAFLWIARIIESDFGHVPWKTWLLNPFVILVSVAWGQLDVLGLAFMLQGIIFFRKEKSFLALLFTGLGAIIKIFPVFIIPLLLFKSKNKWAGLAGLVTSAGLGVLIYFLTGNLVTDANTLIFGRTAASYLGIFESQGLTWQAVIQELGITHFPSLFLYVFIPVYVVFSILAIRKTASVYSYFILTMLMFFLTYNIVNPQYLLWVIGPLILSQDRKGAGIFSMLGVVTMVLSYSYTYFLNPGLSWNYGSSFLGQVEQIRLALIGFYPTLLILGLISSLIFCLEIVWKVRKKELFASSGDHLPNYL